MCKFVLKSSWELSSPWLHLQIKIKTLMLIMGRSPYGQVVTQNTKRKPLRHDTSDWSSSKGAVKSRIALSINGHRYPALLNFAVIALISLSKFDATFRNLCQFTEMVFRLYLFRILEIFDILVLLLHLHCSRYFSVFSLVLGENHLKLQITYLKIHDIWISWYHNILISGYSRQFIDSAIRDFTTHTDENESFIIRQSMFVCTVLWIEQNCFKMIYKETQLVTSE